MTNREELEPTPGSEPYSRPGSSDVFAVGIGASAGGVQALDFVLPHLPASGPAAYVIALHGDPDHESHLVELLAARTRLPVVEPDSGDSIRPGQVYVLPPGHHAEIEQGRFAIGTSSGRARLRPSVDVLFSSLAESFGSRCAGVILDGSGTDGARGLRAIRAAGGITVARDPETATFDGMPCAAVAAGVDLVVSPEEVGPSLGRLIARMEDGGLPDAESDTLDLILSEVKAQSGLDFTPYKRTSLLRRVQRRLALRSCEDLRSYLGFAREHPRELTQLSRDILISVTRFFRDPEAFRSLREAIGTLVGDEQPEESIRAWVPACATGEEAYSVAILLAEVLGPRLERSNVVVYATDVDTEALEYARRGVFTAASLRHVDPDLVERYFWRDGGTFTVKKSLRERMVFAPQNLVEDPPFSQLDIVACRNLLIYLDSSAQVDVLKLFHYALRPGGLLFLGKSESVGSATDLFEPVSKPHRLYRRREGPAETSHWLPKGPTPRSRAEPAGGKAARRPHRDAVAHLLADRLGWPAVLVDGRGGILYVRGDVTDFFNLREGDAALTVIDLAVPALRPVLRSGIHRAARDRETVTKQRVRIMGRDHEDRHVDVEILPAGYLAGRDDALLIVFIPRDEVDQESSEPSNGRPADGRVRELEQDLAATQENLQDAIEELESANAELQALNQELHASNEELQSTNEEFETANEELQATNEELSTVNEELRTKTSALDDANAELRNILTCIVHPLVVVDRELRIKQVSRSATEVLGIEPGSLGLRLPAVAEHPILRELISDIDAVLAGAGPRSRELEHEGRVYHAEVHRFHDHGGPAGALLLVVDDTAIRRREREFRTLADNAPDIIARFDPDLRHVYVNATLEQVTGRPHREWLGRRNRELGLPAEVYEPIEDKVAQVFETGEAQRLEFTFPSPTGERYMQARFVPEPTGTGEIASVLSVARDLTEQIAATRGLEREKARTNSLLESISDGFFSLDADLVVTYFNDPAGRLLGREPESIVGRKLFDAFPEAEGSIFEENYRRALRERKPCTFDTYFAPYDDWYAVRVYPSDEGISVFFQVISEQKRVEQEQARLEREFQHAQKMQALGTLSGGVAHEFNNILMAILGFTELVMGRDEVSGEAAEDLEEVLVAVQRGRSLVDQILAFSRKTAAAQRLVQINDAVSRVLRILESTVPRRIRVTSALGLGLPAVRADPGQLEQVALNLAGNAQDAIPETGTLRIETARETVDAPRRMVGAEMPPGDYVVLRVRDDGSGMTEEVRARAFDPFFTTKGPGEGTGLGLSTVHGIVEAHRGYIACESNPEGGTTFQVFLPAETTSSRPETTAPPRSAGSGVTGQSELILVADDEPSLRQYYGRLLERSGYRALLASNGEQAHEMARDYGERLALVILDLGMPGIGGLGALQRMRADGVALPVVIATGYASPEETAAAEEAGAQAVLRKPFDRESLLELVQETIARKVG